MIITDLFLWFHFFYFTYYLDFILSVNKAVSVCSCVCIYMCVCVMTERMRKVRKIKILIIIKAQEAKVELQWRILQKAGKWTTGHEVGRMWHTKLFTLWIGALIKENFTWGNVMTSYTTGTEGWPAPVVIYVRNMLVLEVSDDRKVNGLRDR